MADVFGGLVTAGINYGMMQKQFSNQMKLQRDSQNYNTLAWNMANEYNSPANQMARFQAAGLNPNLIYGQMSQSASAPSSGTGSASLAQASPMSALESAQIGLLDAQKRQIESNIKLTEKEAGNKDVEGVMMQSQADLNKSYEDLNDANKQLVDEHKKLIIQQTNNAMEEGRKIKVEADKWDSFIQKQIDEMQARIDELGAEKRYFDTSANDIVNTFSARLTKLSAEADAAHWSSEKYAQEVANLCEQYSQEVVNTLIKQAEGKVEGNEAFQWLKQVGQVVTPIIGTIAGVAIGTAGIKGVGGAFRNLKRARITSGYAINGTATRGIKYKSKKQDFSFSPGKHSSSSFSFRVGM